MREVSPSNPLLKTTEEATMFEPGFQDISFDLSPLQPISSDYDDAFASLLDSIIIFDMEIMAVDNILNSSPSTQSLPVTFSASTGSMLLSHDLSTVSPFVFTTMPSESGPTIAYSPEQLGQTHPVISSVSYPSSASISPDQSRVLQVLRHRWHFLSPQVFLPTLVRVYPLRYLVLSKVVNGSSLINIYTSNTA